MSSGDSDNLWRIFQRVSDMPYGVGQIAAVEQLIRQADAQGDDRLAFAARMLGTTAYVYGGEPAKSFVTFSWCLADFDRNPRPYHGQYTHYLLWHFKYMVNAMLTFPEVPLDRTYAVLDDMERRYREGGHSLQAVYKHRHRVARHLGADEEAAEWYRRWTTTPRDDLSDCAGCDPSTQARYLAQTGQDEAAIALAEPVLSGRLSCTEQPQGVLTSLVLPYLRTGRRDAARDAHRRAYRRVRGNLADLWDIGEHVEFCALTGNEARGLEIIERHLDWLDRAPSPIAAMDFAAAAALVLRRLTDSGHGDLTVHRRGHGDRLTADVPVAVLADELSTLAAGIAARFDARNGTPAQSRWVRKRMSAEPIGEHLPLSASIVRPVSTAPVTPDAPTPPTPTPAASVEPEPPADVTPARLLDMADERWRGERFDQFQALLATFDERFAGAELDPAVVARRLEFRAVERHFADDLEGAKAASREAINLFQQVSDPIREQTVTGRLGVLLCLTGEPSEGLPLVEAATAYLVEHGSPYERASGHDRLAVALFQLERWADALAAADQAFAMSADIDDPPLTARIQLRRAHCLTLLDRHEEAASAAAEARDLYQKLNLLGQYSAASLLYAQCLNDPGDAVQAYTDALPMVTEDAALPARTGRGRALMAANRPVEAIDDFVEAVALCVERGIADGAAFLRWELANAYRLAGRSVEAAEVAEEAVAGLDKLGFQGDADRCRHLLATIYSEVDEDESALALLEQLANNLDGPDNLGHRGQVLEEAGDLLYRKDRDALAAQRFAAAANAYQLAGIPLAELRARRREAAALLWAGEPAAAVAAIDRADQVAAALPETVAGEPAAVWEQAMLAENAARVLAGAERVEEGLRRLTGVPERFRSIEAFGEALQVELLMGELLLQLDRPVEAEPILRTALAGMPGRTGTVQRAAWLLSQALAALGRAEEAAALLEEYDIEIED